MKWFKHYCDGSDESLVNELYDEFSHKGYAVYHRLLELCSRQFEGSESHEFQFYEKEITRYTRVNLTSLIKILNFLVEKSVLSYKINKKIITLHCPILLERQDEYTRKVRTRKGDYRTRKEKEQNIKDQITIPNRIQKIGLNDLHIKTILKTSDISEKDLQSSLEAFEFDIVENKVLENKQIKNPIAYFMGTLKKGNLYCFPGKITSKESVVERPNNKKSRSTGNEEFLSWVETLNEDELKDSALYNDAFKFMGDIHKSLLKEHWENNVLS